MQKRIEGKIVDIENKQIFNGVVHIQDGRIEKIEANDDVDDRYFILPGFVDAHVHIESSMLVPSRFAELAVKHGTVATVSDPHEIANVMGIAGVEYMIADGKRVPLKFHFGAPSCVPATPFETSGAVIDSQQIYQLLHREDVFFLAEMMNFPGVIQGDDSIYNKLNAARKLNKPIDGHAPGLSGEDLQTYARAGITTDHETATREEAIEKLEQGIKLQIREGSAAKSLDDLFELIDYYPEDVMLCTDDCHPDDLKQGHINEMVRRAWNKGSDFYDVLRAASYNPVLHYGLDVGLLREGDAADFILVDNLDSLHVNQTYINGEVVFDNGINHFHVEVPEPINKFSCEELHMEDIRIPAKGTFIRVIEAEDRSLVTQSGVYEPTIENGNVVADTDRDILKAVVVNRYEKAKPAVGFVKGFELKRGAIAGSIAHDSHNIIAIGTNDKELVEAVNTVIRNEGGIVARDGESASELRLNVAGLMSVEDGDKVASAYSEVTSQANALGTSMRAPFMTLSFLALLVIPELKLGDKGLFDVNQFKEVELFI